MTYHNLIFQKIGRKVSPFFCITRNYSLKSPSHRFILRLIIDSCFVKQLLELNSLSEPQRILSLKRVFNRDIVENRNFSFKNKKLNPTPAEGEDTMERLFRHLTTVVVDKETRRREYDSARSCRLHWIKYHLEESKKNNVYIFSVDEPEGKRTYIWDKDEDYVIILEPLRHKDEYYLLTAYHIEGKDKARNKMGKKWKRRLQEIL